MRAPQNRSIALCFALLALVHTACTEPGSQPTTSVPALSAEKTVPETEREKTLYSLGAMAGKPLRSFELSESEYKWVARGAADVALQREMAIEVALFNDRVKEMFAELNKSSDDTESAASARFLEEAAAAEGAVKSESGLIMTELVAGGGEAPGATDTVSVHYHGTLRDGTVFDSSVERGSPARFPLNRVIPCWTEALQQIRVGGKSRIVCPSEIAYGARGSGKIPGNAALVFEVELLEIIQ